MLPVFYATCSQPHPLDRGRLSHCQDRRRVAIDLHLKRFDRAVVNMAAILRDGASEGGNGDTAVNTEGASVPDGEVVAVPENLAELEEQCMELVKQHALFAVALDAFKDMPARRYVSGVPPLKRCGELMSLTDPRCHVSTTGGS